MNTQSPLRIGVLGAANIARQFITTNRGSTAVTVASVASRDLAKARAFADEMGVEHAHGSYEALLNDPTIEAIYNPLPNALHASWTIRAANAGKHVLCEKPFAANAMEARAMFEVAEKNGVKVVEAYPYRAQPQIIALKKLIRDGALGRAQTLYAAFGFVLTRGPNDVRWDPTLAGGALMDAGSYPVSLTRMIANERPTHVHAMAHYTERRVDRAVIASLQFPSGLHAQIACSFGTARHRRLIATGDAGMVESTFNNETLGETPSITVTRGAGVDAATEILTYPGVSGFRAQTDSFAQLVRHGWSEWVGATPDESIDIAMMLDAIKQSAAQGSVVKL